MVIPEFRNYKVDFPPTGSPRPTQRVLPIVSAQLISNESVINREKKAES